MIYTATGKVSTFGGPDDMGVTRIEGLALIEPSDLTDPWFSSLFRETEDKGLGLARRLDPSGFYIAARWNYLNTPRSFLRKCFAMVEKGERRILCRLVDWGPHSRTGRVMDLSPGAAAALKLKTDDSATFTLLGHDLRPVILRPS